MWRFDRDLGRRHDSVVVADARVFRISDMVRRLSLRAAVVAILLVCSSACRGPEQPYESLTPGVANLRAQFNADAGNVRILLLPAPT
jgi:hypothetical protein